MVAYTNVFGGSAIPATGKTYAAVALSASTTFSWPEFAVGTSLMADIMDVTPTAAWNMTFPSAALVSTGRDVLIRNPGAFTITLKDPGGNTIGTVASGAVKYLYLTSNATANGVWQIFTFGTGTSAADAAALAGYGTTAVGATLAQIYAPLAKTADYTVLAADQAKTITFTNSGVVNCFLPAAASCVSGFFVNVSNQGTGTLTIDPNGAELVDGALTKAIAPLESCTLCNTGTAWVSVGYGRSTQFQFTKLVLDISAGGTFTLTSAQAENKLLQFTGTITGNVTVVVPAVVAIYYTEAAWTGAFTCTVKTAAGTGIAMSTGDKNIVYCDGVNVVSAQSTSFASGVNVPSGQVYAINGATVMQAQTTFNNYYFGGAGNLTATGVGGNTGGGYQALASVTTGFDLTAIGYQAFQSATTAQTSVAIGYQALKTSVSGANDVAVGFQALTLATNGSNTAVGYTAGSVATTGQFNTLIGKSAGGLITTGSNNTCVGDSAGTDAVASLTTQSNYIVLGNNTTANANIKVAWTVTSDARDKLTYGAVPHGLDFVLGLKPTVYKFRRTRDADEPVIDGLARYGFLAQDIREIEGDGGVIIDDRDPDNLKFNESCLIPVLVRAIQELNNELDILRRDCKCQ